MILKFNYRRTLMVLMAIIILYLQYRLWIDESSLASLASVNAQIKQRTSENESLVERNNALAEEVLALKSGMAVIEQRARTELGMIKQNETFYLVVDDKKNKEDE